MANATSEGPVADTDFEYLPPPNVRFPADDDESDASQFDQRKFEEYSFTNLIFLFYLLHSYRFRVQAIVIRI